jgi:hypothetical protein
MGFEEVPQSLQRHSCFGRGAVREKIVGKRKKKYGCEVARTR